MHLRDLHGQVQNESRPEQNVLFRSDDDAKCGKERVHFVGSNSADGYFEKILIIHFTCCNVKC